jgi:rubrerythrin
VSSPSPTRREALGRGLATSGALAAGGALAGSAATLAAAGRALAETGEEVELVERAAELERDAQVVYETIAEGDLLDEEVAAAAEAFAAQEREHVEALAAALEDLGGRKPPPPPKPADVEGLEDAESQSDALELAVDVENALLRAYGDVAEASSNPALLKTVTEIALNAAQHLVVLRQQLGEPALPEAFETGKAEKG